MKLLFSKSKLLGCRILVLVAGISLCLLNFYSSVFLPLPNKSGWQQSQSTPIAFVQSNYLKINDASQRIHRREPSHEACHNKNNQDGYEGIYHIAMTDILGGVGTALIHLVLGQLMYADFNNLKPWIYLNNQSQVFFDPLVHGAGPGVSLTAMVGRNATFVAPARQSFRNRRDYIPGPPNSSNPVTRQTLHFEGTGVWEHYFEPVSDFVPGDRSCESKLYVTMDLYLITPGLHGFSQQYAMRSWRYDYLPEYISQPHIPLHEWLLPQRRRANKIMSKYIRFQKYLLDMAARVNPNCHMQSNPCLGLHIRHSDKAAGRRQIAVKEFLPYALEFVQQGGTQIYLATDSNLVVTEIQQTWPVEVRSRVRSLGRHVIRSNNKSAVFDMASHHRTNQEALVEILALSQCQFMVHGLSALSESSIWINLDLHYRSVNLEDVDHLDESTFAILVRRSSEGKTALDQLPHPPQTDHWWNQLLKLPESSNHHHQHNGACDGYKGIMHIATVPKDAGPGQAFFESVLNQFLLAKQLNLVPWVRLSCSASEILHDSSVELETIVSLQAAAYVELRSGSTGQWELPGDVSASSIKSFKIPGCNTWDLYFEPVGNPNDKSCANKPVFVLNEVQVSNELGMHTPGLVHAWRRNEMPENVWNPNQNADWKAVMWPMRQEAHEVISQYYQAQSPILQRAQLVNPIQLGEVCMAVHIRATDKNHRNYRKKVTAEQYTPYMESFVRAGGQVIYIGTDSSRALRYLSKSLPDTVKNVTRNQGQLVVRSDSRTIPPYALDSHHRVNSETLVDIYAMSKCHILLHSFSTVAEVAIYLNPNLHNTSVNLEDPQRLNSERFEQMVASLVNQHNL